MEWAETARAATLPAPARQKSFLAFLRCVNEVFYLFFLFIMVCLRLFQ